VFKNYPGAHHLFLRPDLSFGIFLSVMGLLPPHGLVVDARLRSR